MDACTTRKSWWASLTWNETLISEHYAGVDGEQLVEKRKIQRFAILYLFMKKTRLHCKRVQV